MECPKVLDWSPKAVRDAEAEGPRLVQDLVRVLSGSAPVILVTPMRGSLPQAARDLPWQVIRAGGMDRDRIVALLAARAPQRPADWRTRGVSPK